MPEPLSLMQLLAEHVKRLGGQGLESIGLGNAQLVTDQEKATLQGWLDKMRGGIVPPAAQQEYQQMKQDPISYLREGVKQPPPLVEDMPGTVTSLAGAMPIAFHGTPHTWAENKPDISKVGTGQGAQSYGHGLYFAENPQVAQQYADELAKMTVGGKTMNVAEAGRVFGGTPEGKNLRGKDIYDTANYIVNSKIAGKPPVNFHPPGSEEAALFEKMNKEIGVSKGMYQVNIPDEHVAKMLDWDKPLKDQPEILAKLNQALKDADILPQAGISEKSRQMGLYGNMTGGEAYRYIHQLPEDASAKLQKLGIPGIKYLDQGSRQAGQGTRNFVVFDPNVVTDVKKQ